MARRYSLNYDWSKLGPTKWTDSSVVSLQFDLHSYERGRRVQRAVREWWSAMPHDHEPELLPDAAEVAYDGGCRFPEPVVVDDRHLTGWIVSQGQDAFDSIADSAEDLRRVVESADPEAEIVWTELPHR